MSDLSVWLASIPPAWRDGCPDVVFTRARECYDSPGRFHHTWDHVIDCTRKLRGFECGSPRRVFLALVFHDAVYFPDRPDNERNSADLAGQLLRQHASLSEEDIAVVERMILATKDHRAGDTGERELCIALDIDMSILGAPWPEYQAYAENVRREYCPSVASDRRFNIGRATFLSKTLASKSIFHTPEGISLWEQSARDNAARELNELRSSQGLLGRALSAILRRL